METNQAQIATKKDYLWGTLAGLLIGILFLPILKAAKPSLFDKLAIAVIPFFLLATPVGLVVASWISKKIAVVWQIAKFALIGVLNTLVDLGVLSLLIFIFRSYLHIDSRDILIGALGITFYSLYKSISFISANVNSYFWNKYWTFGQGAEKKSSIEFAQFFVVSVVGFIVNVAFASYVFKSIAPVAGLNPDQWGLIGAAVGSIAGLTWNFVGYKFIVFKK